jgi:hypothetical protein
VHNSLASAVQSHQVSAVSQDKRSVLGAGHRTDQIDQQCKSSRGGPARGKRHHKASSTCTHTVTRPSRLRCGGLHNMAQVSFIQDTATKFKRGMTKQYSCGGAVRSASPTPLHTTSMQLSNLECTVRTRAVAAAAHSSAWPLTQPTGPLDHITSGVVQTVYISDTTHTLLTAPTVL